MAFRAHRPLRILHLEDSARDADLIGHRLEAGGISCEIVVANSRDTFEAALRREPFDVVLCDYNVPGYDGLTALARSKDVRPDAPVIIISGSVGEDEAVRCLHMGATDYLLKQHLERLAPAVSRAIGEARERRSRARAEEALQERERRLSSIFEAAADSLFYVDVENDGTYRIAAVNPAFLVTTGLQHDDVVGRRVEEVLPAPETAVQHYTQAIRERRAVRWEETAEFPSGRRIGEVSVTPVFDSVGTCTHLVGAVHDVTERRQLEAQLRHSQKMESVGQLAGGIAHDFNNLLTVINGMAELALADIKKSGQLQIENDLQEIRRAGERAAGLTRQLLTFSRKQIVQPQVIDLSTVISDMGNMLRRLLGEDIELAMTSTGDHTNIKADRGQVEQVIANLAVNARDAMPHGGPLSIEVGTVDVGAEDIQGSHATVAPGAFVTLAVRDTGTGMDDTTRRQIFEPFFTTKGPGKGTGLGLSTVYGIVKQSGGFIRVESSLGRGSCFTVYFPQAARDAAGQSADSTTATMRGTETILVVEDVMGLRRLMTRTLESAGYKVLTAATGDEALRVLEAYGEAVHLMITDVVMPGMSGRSLAESLESLRPDMKVLYMSGYTDDVILRHGVLEEGRPFVSKPFGTADLLRKIRELLSASRSQ